MDAVQTTTHPTPADAFDELLGKEPAPTAPTTEEPTVPTVQNLNADAATDESPAPFPEESPHWVELKAACPLWGVGVISKVTNEITAAMAVRRRAAGDQLVIDLIAWGRVYRTAAEERKGKAVVEMSGYGRTRLCLGVRMLEAVEDNNNVIPRAWTGQGPDGVASLLEPTAKKGKAPKGEPTAAATVDPKLETKALREVAKRLAEPAVGAALAADPETAKRAASDVAKALWALLDRLPEEDMARALGHLTGAARAKRAALPPKASRTAQRAEAAHRRMVEAQPAWATTMALFGEEEEAEQAPEHLPPPTA